MSVVPSLDLRAANDPAAMASLPANVDAESALLGAVLYDNSAFERLPDGLRAEHFFEPLHKALYEKIEALIRKGHLAEPITLGEALKPYAAFEEYGGLSYLAQMVDHAPPAANAADFARIVLELAKRRELIHIGGDITALATTPEDGQTSTEILEAAEHALYALAETGQTSQGFQTAEHYLTGAVEMAAAAYGRDGGLSGLSTGLLDLDQKTGGLHPSDLFIVAARPSQGKTALALNVAFHVARRYAYEPQPDGSRKTTAGGRVAFFSLEMSAEQLGLRLLAEASGVSGDRLRRGDIDASEFGRVRDAAVEIQSMPLLVDATGAITLPKLAARARRMKRQGGLDLIVVDYLQLMSSGSRTENRVQEVSAITVGLKALAKDLSVPVVALSQLSRQVEQRDNKRPQLSDLRESGSIEQDADVVAFIYRDEYYLGRAEPKAGTKEYDAWTIEMDEARGKAELIIGKQRHGPIGTVHLAFNEDLTKFGNLARDGQYDGRAVRKPYGDN